MNSNTACLGPYKFSSPDFPGVSGPLFVDQTKTKCFVTVFENDSIPVLPSFDSILLHESKNETHTMRWYECPSILGRTYRLIATPCEVFITYFEDGFIYHGGCDALEFGSESYCFGRIQEDESYKSEDYFTSFSFDGHRFYVEGQLGNSFGVFDCNNCSSEFQSLSFVDSIESIVPPPATDPSTTESNPEEEEEEEETNSNNEQLILWPAITGDNVNIGSVCNEAVELEAASDCQSRDNPSIAILPSGHSLVAYESRNDSGMSSIKISVLNTTVNNKILYYRNLSRGRLLNDDSIAYGVGSFEIYDDVQINLNGNSPAVTLYLGFLTGPLAGGSFFRIESAERVLADDKRYKWVFTFDPGARPISFSDSNDVSDVSFIISYGSMSAPSIGDLLTLPDHVDSFNNPVPVSNPTITVAKNALMIDTSQNIYLAYQAFVDGKWNVYAKHIRITEKNAADPSYNPPYTFSPPSVSFQNLNQTEESDVVYRVIDRQINGVNLCVLFEVFLQDNRQVLNCGNESGNYQHDCGMLAEKRIASVEVVYLSSCSADWPSIGDEFTGSWESITTSIFSPSESCIQNISVYPSSSQWCVLNSSCTQYFLFDDPYCPSPYKDFIDVEYKPSDLWTVKIGDDYVTRVLYNMSATVVQTEDLVDNNAAVDFMFVIDHSGSMVEEIDKVRQAVPLLSQNLVSQGFDVKFGLVVFGRGSVAGRDPSEFCITENSRVFNGLQAANCRSTCLRSSLPGIPGGFTSDVSVFSDYLCCWGHRGGRSAPWLSIQYAIYHESILWRESSFKFMMLITDAGSEASESIDCTIDNNIGSTQVLTNTKSDALNSLISNNITFLCSVCIPPSEGGTCTSGDSGSVFIDMPQLTGWTGEQYYNVSSESYNATFEDISRNINITLSGLSIVERDNPGYSPTFIKQAEVLITYEGDISDIWTNDKEKLVFTDVPPVDIDRMDKGLSKLPYPIYSGKLYGVDSVSVSSKFSNWVYYSTPGSISLAYPDIGVPPSGRTSPILIAENARKPRIVVNNRNGVIIAYEKLEFGLPQIHISGTSDLHYGGIIGPKGSRITRFLEREDFIFSHEITGLNDGINQLADFCIDDSDICHVVWQSNRDGYWEIYYANSSDSFENTRITKFESRSSHPKIDIGKDGSVYVVYQDNRFGPFNIFLSYKDERRFLPLLQQDAYLASLRNNYTHFTNTMPFIIRNEGKRIPEEGLFWATKIASDIGNGSENYVFNISDLSLNQKDGGGNTSPYEIIAIAGSRDGTVYGVSSDFILLKMAEASEDDVLQITPAGFVEIGVIDIGDNQTIHEMSVDNVGRLWISVIENLDGNTFLKLLEINPNDSDILRESVVFEGNVTGNVFGFTCLNSGDFYFVSHRYGTTKFSKSSYPFIVASSANFVVEEISGLVEGIKVLSSDNEDSIHGIDDTKIYRISELGTAEELVDLSPPEDVGNPTEGADPVQKLSGFGYQFTGGTVAVGDSGYYHARIEFYDNINLEGDPLIVVDSRSDLEAFINVDFETGDPYIEDAYFAGAKGVYLQLGESRFIAFDASHFRPNQTRLSYPYSFDTNQTYFPKIYSISQNNEFQLISEVQKSSFSCNKCTKIGDNVFDYHACSFSYVISQIGVYNFVVAFYSDSNYYNSVRKYEARYNSPDIDYFEVNNKKASDAWTSDGLLIGEDDSVFIQVYPSLDPNSGLICGVNYYVKVYNLDNEDEIYSNGIFFCECSSNIFSNSSKNLFHISRWHSSSNGFSDTKITDSIKDSVLPSIKTRSSGSAIIVFEDRLQKRIKAATFRKSDPLEIFGSGTKSWFDYDFGIDGQNPDIDIDIFDRPILVYEVPQEQSSSGLPRNSVFSKSCSFEEEGLSTTSETCESDSLTSNVIAKDDFISSDIIKKVIVKPEYVDYYTYNSENKVASVVSKCKIVLQIIGTPEVVAYRLRNEGNSSFSKWCASSPEISNYTTELEWSLTKGSGIKEVCVQAMTYNGVTTEFCVPIIADYVDSSFEVVLYSDEDYSELLPIYNNMFVASTKFNTVSGDPYVDRDIYIEIIPDKEIIGQSIINYDVIQQGDSDLLNQVAEESFANGRQVFRGKFSIYKEDKVLNVDGLTRIIIKSSDECKSENQVTLGSFNKDTLNVHSDNTTIDSVTDSIEPYRQSISGKIGTGVSIRPNEDPYFVFGDPSFFLR